MSVRSLPSSPEAEKYVLGYALKDQDALSKLVSDLKEEDFYSEINQTVFSSIHTLFRKGKLVSVIGLSDYLQGIRSLEEIGGLIYLYELTEIAKSRVEFFSHIETVKDKSIKRNLIKGAKATMDLAYDDAQESGEILQKGFEHLWSSSPMSHAGIEIISSGKIYEKRVKGFKSRKDTRSILSGYPSIDEVLVRGFQTKELSVLAGRPGQGKSSIKSNLIKNQLEQGLCVVSFTPEQTFEVEQARIETLLTDIPLGEILTAHTWQKGDYRIKELKRVNSIIDKRYKYHIVPSRRIETTDIRTVLYQIAQRQPIDIIYIDLFDRLSDVAVVNQKAQTVASKLNVMNQIAEEFDCHVCLLVQASREVEKRSDKRPKISDLKDAGAYEEAARLIILLYREKYYNPDSLDSSIEVIIGKNSNGPVTTLKMDFDLKRLKLEEKGKSVGKLI